MHELLGLINNQHKFNYDENGFLMQSDNIHNDSMIEFNVYYDEKCIEQKSSDIHFFNFRQVKKSDNVYVYDISVIEETQKSDFLAFGIVEIHYDGVDITKIIVNNVENGCLKDKYDDCFNIKPFCYMNLIYSKYKDLESEYY
jgi:hypothetical protein